MTSQELKLLFGSGVIVPGPTAEQAQRMRLRAGSVKAAADLDRVSRPVKHTKLSKQEKKT
jgi:hypothetical protein